MTPAVEPASRRSPVKPAMVAALGVLVVLVALMVIPTALSLMQADNAGEAIGPWAGVGATEFALGHLPFAIGVFLSLWIVLPITAGLRVGAVLARGVLASVLGGVAAGIVALLVHEVTGPQTPLDLGLLLGVLDAILRDVALVVLAAVLLWLWLRRERAAPEV